MSLVVRVDKDYLVEMSVHPIRPKEPMLNVEDPAPFWLAAVLFLSYLGFTLAPASFQEFVYQACVLGANKGTVFLDARPLGNLPTLLTHTLLHVSWGHVLMNSVFIVVFGIITIRGVQMKNVPLFGHIRRGSAIFLAIFLLGSIAGGLGQWLQWIVFESTGAALGASTGGAALFASAAWVIGGQKRLISFGIVLVVLDFANTLLGAHPAWAGHLGGYLAGAPLAMLWLRPNNSGIGMFG